MPITCNQPRSQDTLKVPVHNMLNASAKRKDLSTELRFPKDSTLGHNHISRRKLIWHAVISLLLDCDSRRWYAPTLTSVVSLTASDISFIYNSSYPCDHKPLTLWSLMYLPVQFTSLPLINIL